MIMAAPEGKHHNKAKKRKFFQNFSSNYFANSPNKNSNLPNFWNDRGLFEECVDRGSIVLGRGEAGLWLS